MLALHTCAAGQAPAEADLSGAELPPGILWVDMFSPDAAEIAFVERGTGLRVPSAADLSEIESSSRLRTVDGALYLSTPLVFRARADDPQATPVGFVLTRDRLITVRFDGLRAFDTFMESTGKSGLAHRSSAGVFTGIFDAIVDRIADTLELVGADLDSMSHRLFSQQMATATSKQPPARADADLREMLRRVGHGGDLVSKIRYSLLGIGRIVPYVASAGAGWLPADTAPHFDTLRQDIASLADYDAHLTNKVQLLLDATLGLINIEQNNIIKVLTVVSVVGVPPTLVASLYGMNFKYMPELDWAWGYPYGLAMIVLSAILPLLWFKLRGWL